MEYRIVERESFLVVGKSIPTSQDDNMNNQTISKFWTQSNSDGFTMKLGELSEGKPFLGLCFNDAPDGSFSYMIGIETNQAIPNLESLFVDKAKWAVFESVGALPDAIQQVWHEIFTDFFPNSPYKHAPVPDFEAYFGGETTSPTYVCEVWIPIILK